MTLSKDLEQFTGTERWHKISPFSSILITDGVKYFADKGEAYWAVCDILATATALKEDFLLAKVISENGKAVIEYEDGDCNKLEHATAKYPHTDLEAGVYKFYITDGIMLLPSEY